MPIKDEIGHGLVFEETRKKSERSPDWRGDLVINGEKLGVLMWVKDKRTSKGSRMMSLSIVPYEERRGEGATPAGDAGFKVASRQRMGSGDPDDDDIPF